MKSDDLSEIENPKISGVRGRMDRLANEYLRKAQALRLAVEIMDAEVRATAQAFAPQKFLKAIQHRNGAAPAPKKQKKRRKVVRQSADDRRATLTRYLMSHPGADTNDIAGGLGWRKNQVLKFAPMVARAEGKGGRANGPRQWYLGESKKKATKAKRTVRQPRQERLDQIQGFLQRHPEATTSAIAKAVGVKPNSSFVKLVRQVAHPARPTVATQPIPWVLT